MTEKKWALFKDFHWFVAPVVKITDKRVVVNYHTYERHLISSEVKVSSDEEVLQQAAQKLTSSDALYREEVKKAGLRQRDRDNNILSSIS